MDRKEILKKWADTGLFNDIESMTTGSMAGLMESEAAQLLIEMVDQNKNSKIKIQVLDPVGTILHEIETNYSSDQLDRFISQTRITIISDEEPIHFISEKSR